MIAQRCLTAALRHSRAGPSPVRRQSSFSPATLSGLHRPRARPTFTRDPSTATCSAAPIASRYSSSMSTGAFPPTRRSPWSRRLPPRPSPPTSATEPTCTTIASTSRRTRQERSAQRVADGPAALPQFRQLTSRWCSTTPWTSTAPGSPASAGTNCAARAASGPSSSRARIPRPTARIFIAGWAASPWTRRATWRWATASPTTASPAPCLPAFAMPAGWPPIHPA